MKPAQGISPHAGNQADAWDLDGAPGPRRAVHAKVLSGPGCSYGAASR